MASLEELRDKVASVDVWQELKAVLQSEIEYILSLNKGQLMKGLLSTGKNTKEYSQKSLGELGYVSGKIELGSYNLEAYPYVNLFMTGDFYSGFVATLKDTYIEITSTDSKTPELITKYSSDIFGLTEENIAVLIITALPKLNTRIRQKLNL